MEEDRVNSENESSVKETDEESLIEDEKVATEVGQPAPPVGDVIGHADVPLSEQKSNNQQSQHILCNMEEGTLGGNSSQLKSTGTTPMNQNSQSLTDDVQHSDGMLCKADGKDMKRQINLTAETPKKKQKLNDKEAEEAFQTIDVHIKPELHMDGKRTPAQLRKGICEVLPSSALQHAKMEVLCDGLEFRHLQVFLDCMICGNSMLNTIPFISMYEASYYNVMKSTPVDRPPRWFDSSLLLPLFH